MGESVEHGPSPEEDDNVIDITDLIREKEEAKQRHPSTSKIIERLRKLGMPVVSTDLYSVPNPSKDDDPPLA